jgi:hypothetical protein
MQHILCNLELYLSYKIEIVCVCVFACSLRTDVHRFATNLACLFLEIRKRFWKGQSSGKSVLSSNPAEGGSCSSEIKHGRRTARRTKLFFSKRKLQKRRSEPRKPVLRSNPGEDVFCSSENMHDRRMAQRTKLFRKEISGRVTSLKTVLVSSLGEEVGFRDNNSFFCDFQRYVSNDQAYDNLSGNKD